MNIQESIAKEKDLTQIIIAQQFTVNIFNIVREDMSSLLT